MSSRYQPKGGPEPQNKELVFRGPFKGPEQHTDAYFLRDGQTPTDSRNVDLLFGDIQGRPGIQQLAVFDEPDTVAAGQEVHIRRVFTPSVMPVDKSLMFMESPSAIDMPYGGTSYSQSTGALGTRPAGPHPAMTDVIASGHWYTMDALLLDKYGQPPVGNWKSDAPNILTDMWQYPRYKVVSLGGVCTFKSGSPDIFTLAATPEPPFKPDWDGLHIVGGYIRETLRTPSSTTNYATSLYRIVFVEKTIAAPGVPPYTYDYQIHLDRPWNPGNVLGLAAPPGPYVLGDSPDASYAIFLPIVDTEQPHASGPFYKMGSDYCPMPGSQASFQLNITGTTVVRAQVAQSPEFSFVDISDEAGGRFVKAGMGIVGSLGTLAEPVTTSRGIVRVDVYVATVTTDPTGVFPLNSDVYRCTVWPPYSNVADTTFNDFLVTGRTQYFVTGAPGSTVISPGCNPISGQKYGNDPSYVANCCTTFGNRIVIGSDMSYTKWEVNPSNSLHQSLNWPDPQYHPGRVVWSGNGFFDDFSSPYLGAGFIDLPIGPITWLFTMRDAMYAMSETGMMVATLTGEPSNPFAFRLLFSDKKFAWWAKPKVIDDSMAIIAGTDELFIFNGTAIKPIGTKIREVYQQMVTNTGSVVRPAPNRLYYEQSRGRVYLFRQSASASPVPHPGECLVQGLDSGDWSSFRLPDYTGGGAKWSTNFSGSGGDTTTKREHLDVETLMHTTGQTIQGTQAKDRIMAFRWSKTSDEQIPPLADVQIPWVFEFPYFDMGTPRDYKTVSRIRVVYQISGAGPAQLTVDLTGNDGERASVTSSGDMNIGGTPPGDVREAWFTGATPATALNVTGFTFKMSLYATSGIQNRIIVREVAVTYRDRPELRQF